MTDARDGQEDRRVVLKELQRVEELVGQVFLE